MPSLSSRGLIVSVGAQAGGAVVTEGTVASRGPAAGTRPGRAGVGNAAAAPVQGPAAGPPGGGGRGGGAGGGPAAGPRPGRGRFGNAAAPPVQGPAAGLPGVGGSGVLLGSDAMSAPVSTSAPTATATSPGERPRLLLLDGHSL